MSRYSEIRVLGKGGYATVHLCKDEGLGRYVAIKRISAAKVKSESKRELRELHIMANINHPNIVPLLHAFTGPEDADGSSPFDLHIVMPYMKTDLTRLIRDRPHMHQATSSGDAATFHATTATSIAFQIAFGMDHLHKSNIVHRDLKPDNILVNPDITDPLRTVAYITDFGLARDIVEETDTYYVTTKHYRAPEAVTNSDASNTPLDVWSFGCILYELLTGATLFRLDSARDHTGSWSGPNASLQLERILDVIGTPSAEEIDAMPTCNVKSYLYATKPRPRRIEEMISTRIAIDVPTADMADWVALISACVQFSPEKRPTFEHICRNQLFVRAGIVYGVNVTQPESEPYSPPDTSSGKQNLIELAKLVAAVQAKKAEEEMTVTFPAVSDDLIAQFAKWPLDTNESVQKAIESVIALMDQRDNSADRMQELAAVLNFFVVVQPTEPLDASDQ